VPRMPHERFHGSTKLGFRGDTIIEFDWCVGEIMKTLSRLQLDEKTLVVLCSDNGPVLDDGYQDGALEKIGEHRAAGPYSGGKYSVYEGGTRTPFITRWKGKIKPAVSDNMVCTIDLSSSLASLAGVQLPEDACRDSLDVSDALLGVPDARGREELVQQDNSDNSLALRVGPWKLHRYANESARNVVVEKELANTKVPRVQLFNLDKDPAEKHNVIEAHPEVAERLKSRLASIIESNRTRP
jgi:arylsulfatase A-like enzyme